MSADSPQAKGPNGPKPCRSAERACFRLLADHPRSFSDVAARLAEEGYDRRLVRIGLGRLERHGEAETYRRRDGGTNYRLTAKGELHVEDWALRQAERARREREQEAVRPA